MKENVATAYCEIASGKMPAAEAAGQLVAMMTEYPYFVAPAALLLKRYGSELTEEQRRQAETVVGTRGSAEMLFTLADRRGADFENFYPPERPRQQVTTDDAITTFLKNYGSDSSEETAMLERLIFNPVPDYASVLAAEAGDAVPAADETSSRIDSFISAHGDATPRQEPEPAEPQRQRVETPPADALLSESLARIFVKQRRYDKAYEIISQLSLNYPEKSCYFADQLRFLKKLIINQTTKNK